MTIAPGTYKAMPRDAVMGKTSKGAEQLGIAFEILDGDEKGKTITAYLYFSEKSVDRTLESLEHCGWDGESLRDLRTALTREVSIVVELDTYEGKTSAKVRWINSGAGAAVKEKLEPAAIVSLEQRLKGKMLARKQERQARGDDSFNYGANDDPP